MGVPCLTLRSNTERPITVTLGTNIIVGQDREKLSARIVKNHQRKLQKRDNSPAVGRARWRAHRGCAERDLDLRRGILPDGSSGNARSRVTRKPALGMMAPNTGLSAEKSKQLSCEPAEYGSAQTCNIAIIDQKNSSSPRKSAECIHCQHFAGMTWMFSFKPSLERRYVMFAT